MSVPGDAAALPGGAAENCAQQSSAQRDTLQSPVEITVRDGTVVFSVRVQPRASRDEVTGVMGGAIKIRLQAPAVADRANASLIEFLAQLLKTPKSAVRILSGERSRQKRVEVRGVTEQAVLALLTQQA